MFLVPADKAANNVVVVDDCIILILLSVSLLTPMPINCSLLGVRGWLSMGMVVIKPYILVSKLKKPRQSSYVVLVTQSK